MGDVVVNEILFNSFTGGVDFVELFNCSNKIVDVAGWSLINKVASSGTRSERVNEARLFLPGDYLVFTPDPQNIISNYPSQAQASLLINQRLPSLPDDLGNISVLNAVGDTLDSFTYSNELHSALLDDEDGVSLERINPKNPTQQPGNWFSAASEVGFASPTRPNSQFRTSGSNPEGEQFFFLTENTVSPDGDGRQDALQINYQTPAAGWNARLRIFDATAVLSKP
ncbi:MAG: lamin tail domain-containing protein [Lewinella sp.]|nr:lamin tail domain-containing protein [Lewinella sp.]